jgi:beta-1,2-mannobiose phosphorylase / 1,2-beta-oligomannan phosphorylase
MILPPHNQDCVIFDEKIRDRFYAFHGARGSRSRDRNSIWLAESPDSIHWGNHKCVASTRADMWDSARVSAGCAPIETPQGWLTIYQGTDDNGRVCLGALLLSSREPSVVIARSETPLMEPTEVYEAEGLTGNAMFTNGHLVVGDKLKLYYSVGGQVICGAELSIQEILATLKKA